MIGIGTKLTGVSGKTYTIDSNFYGGATATLFRAHFESDVVMVKVIWRGLMPGSRQWEQFSREQRSAESLTHRNIVQILDRGLHGGYPFIVMEFLGGGTLRDLLQRQDRIPGEDILSISSQVAEAIDFAHSRGILHRDIKPRNILLASNPQGRVALSDFGIAKMLGTVEKDITAQPGSFTGSPAYMAPETLYGDMITNTSDIYSFGIVLFELITGSVPFDDQPNALAVIRAKVEEDAPSLTIFRPVSNQSSTRIAQTLSRDPQDRPGTAREVLAGIEPYLRIL